MANGPISLDGNMRIHVSGNDGNHKNSDTVKRKLKWSFYNLSKTNKLAIPFVIPTVISESMSTESYPHIRLLVDLTPRMVSYYEITWVKQAEESLSSEQPQYGQRHECVAVGLATKSFQNSCKMPGWDVESYGYHSDDGGMFHAKPRYGQPTFGPGDTIGCGVEYTSRRIFFTKNAEFLGFEFGKLRKHVVEKGLYPTVGIDTKCPIFVNFGEHPFMFDLKNIQDHVRTSSQSRTSTKAANRSL